MPLWLFAALFLLLSVVTFVVGVGALWAAARIVRVRASLRKVILLALAMLGVAFFFAALDLAIPMGEGQAIFLGLTSLVAYVVAVKMLLSTGWWRSIGILAIYLVLTLAATLVLVFGFMSTIGKAFKITDDSMSPGLFTGDSVIVDRTASPQRWDMIAFYAPVEPTIVYMKRIVGLPGETIEIVDGEILVNGEVVPRPASLGHLQYLDHNPWRGSPCHGCNGSPITLAGDEYYVLGDNSHRSMDSRFWTAAETGAQLGAVPRRSIIGVARIRYAPLGRMAVLDVRGQ